MAENKQNNQSKSEEQAPSNEIRVGQRRSEAYVKIAEQLLIQHEELILTGLGNSTIFF